MACIAPSGMVVTPDGTEVTGESIGHLLAQLTSSEQHLRIRCGRTLRVGNLALSTQYWTRSSPVVELERFEVTSTARLVLGLSGAGWQVHIGAPWG